MNEKEVMVFMVYGCRYCDMLKDGLDKNGIRYKGIDVGLDNGVGDIIESTYKCTKYPMVIFHKINRSLIWLPETELLPSPNVRIYNTIEQLIKEIKYEVNS